MCYKNTGFTLFLQFFISPSVNKIAKPEHLFSL